MSRVVVFERFSPRILLTILLLLTISPLLPVSAQATPLDAIDDFYSMDAGAASLSGNVLTNDIGSGLHVINYVTPNHGSVTGTPDGNFTYTPPAGFTGDAVFYYEVNDAAGARDASTVVVTVSGTAPPPTDPPPPPGAPLDAIDDFYSMDASAGSLSGNVLTNDIGSGLHVVNYVTPNHGSVSGSPDGSFTYTPPAGFTGDAVFYYEVNDAAGARDASTVVITVRGGGGSGTLAANPDTFEVVGQGFGYFEVRTFAAPGVLANDTGSSLRVTGNTNAARGAVVVSADGSFTYEVHSGFTGVETFTYTITDASGATATATVTLNVVKPPLNAVDDVFEVLSGTSDNYLRFTLNDAISDRRPRISVVSDVSHGTLSLTGYGNVGVYTPAPGFVGTDSFRYRVEDVFGQTDEGLVTIHVLSQGARLDAIDDFYTMDAGAGSLSGNVLTNDIGSGLRVTNWVRPNHGSVSGTPDGSFTYTPPAGFTGDAVFYYEVYDAAGARDASTVVITVRGGGGSGTLAANADTFEVAGHPGDAPEVQRDFAAPGVLANDSGTGIRVTSFTQPARGTVQVNADGSFRYMLPVRLLGVQTFTYTIMDAASATATATVTLNITATPPDAVDDAFTVAAGSANNQIGVLENDTWVAYRYPGTSIVSGPSHGTLLPGDSYGFVRLYTPNPGFSGVDTFRYRLTDGFGRTDEAVVTINVVAQGARLDAIDDFYTMDASAGSLTGNVLTNDVGSGLHVTNWVRPNHGSVSGAPDGSFTYTPPAGFTGDAVFYYEVYDAAGARDASTVVITVRGGGGSGTLAANPDTYNLSGHDFGFPIFYEVPAPGVLGNDSGEGIHVISNTNAPVGAVIVNPDGSFRYGVMVIGVETFTYTIMDAAGQTATTTVTMNVAQPELDAVDDTFTVLSGSRENELVLTRNDVVNVRRVNVSVVSEPSHGSLSLTAYGNVGLYTPEPGFVGTDSFRYRLADRWQTDEAVVTITVTPAGPVDAIDDFYELDAGSPGLSANVLRNDIGVGLHVTNYTQPAHGAVDMAENGNFGYTPEPGYLGTVVFYYEVYDSGGARDASTVMITIVNE